MNAWTPPPDGFALPNDSAPLDADAHIAATPADAEIRGMFFQAYLDEAARRGVTLPARRTYTAFKMYSMREWQAFAVEAAQALYPQTTLRGALRKMGLSAYPTFADSIVGRVVFGVLGKDLSRIMRVASKGFEHSTNCARAEIVDAGADFARLRLLGVYGFVDSYNVGVFEGAITVCEKQGDVFVRSLGVAEAEVFCRWR